MEKEKDKKSEKKEKEEEAYCQHPRQCWYRGNVKACSTCTPWPNTKVLRG